MSFVAYFLGGPEDLTKRVIQYPEHDYLVAPLEPLWLSGYQGRAEIGPIRRHRYELAGTAQGEDGRIIRMYIYRGEE